MKESTVLLICNEPQLIETTHEIVCSMDGLRLRIIAEIEELFCPSRQIADAVVLIHLTQDNDGVQAARLLGMLASTQQLVPVLVLSDQHRPEQILDLRRLGVADCLSRPLDLHRQNLAGTGDPRIVAPRTQAVSGD